MKLPLLVFLLACAPREGFGALLIEEHRVSLRVAEDGVVHVEEAFRFSKAPPEFARLIPTKRMRLNGLRQVSGLKIVSVRADGKEAPFTLKDRPKGRLLIAGRPGKTFELSYATNRRIGRFDAFDALSWDATGPGWEIPIQNARLDVALPGPVSEAILARAFVGKPGDPTEQYAPDPDEKKALVFRLDRTLEPGERLRTAIRFPTDWISPAQEGKGRALLENLHLAVGLAGVFVLLWMHLGSARRLRAALMQESPKIRETPPQGVSPATAHWLIHGLRAPEVGLRILDALKQKGYLIIGEENGVPVAKKGPDEARNTLAHEEISLADELLGKNDSVTLADPAAMARAESAATRTLERIWMPQLRRRYYPGLWIGWWWTAGVLAAMRIAGMPERSGLAFVLSSLIQAFSATLAGALLIALWTWTYRFWKRASVGDADRRVPNLLNAVILGFISFGMVTMSSDFLYRHFMDVSPLLLVESFALLAINWVFWNTLVSPTPEGWRALLELEGYRRHLESLGADIPEQDRPYAVALGVAGAYD